MSTTQSPAPAESLSQSAGARVACAETNNATDLPVENRTASGLGISIKTIEGLMVNHMKVELARLHAAHKWGSIALCVHGFRGEIPAVYATAYTSTETTTAPTVEAAVNQELMSIRNRASELRARAARLIDQAEELEATP